MKTGEIDQNRDKFIGRRIYNEDFIECSIAIEGLDLLDEN